MISLALVFFFTVGCLSSFRYEVTGNLIAPAAVQIKFTHDVIHALSNQTIKFLISFIVLHYVCT